MEVIKTYNKYTGKQEWAIVNVNSIPIVWLGQNTDKAEEELDRLSKIKEKAEEAILELHEISGDLRNKGIIHIADAITNCIIYILKNYSQEENIIKLDKIISLLMSRKELDLVDRLQPLLPDILACKNIDLEDFEVAETKISALRAYNIVKILKNRYENGDIGPNDFEYDKMIELETLLKMGFVLSKPRGYKALPKTKNWWEHFEYEKTGGTRTENVF